MRLLAAAALLQACAFHPPARLGTFSCDEQHPCPDGMQCLASASVCIDPTVGVTPCGPEFEASPNHWFDSFEDPTCDEVRERQLPRWKLNATFSHLDTDSWSFESGLVPASGARSCLVNAPAETPEVGVLRWYAFTDRGDYVPRQLKGRICISARVQLKSGGPASFHLSLYNDGSTSVEPLVDKVEPVSSEDWTMLQAEYVAASPIDVDVKIYADQPQPAAFYVDDVFIGSAP